MPASFSSKVIRVSFTLASGTFDGTNNTTVISDLRTSVEVEKGGHPSKNSATLKVYGMKESDMKLLTTLSFRPLAVKKNLVEVLAGDASGMSLVFKGEISEAWSNYQSAPNLYFHVKGVSGYYPAIAPVAPTSYKGAVPVSTIMAKLAAQMGYTFQDNGVTGVLVNPYLPGTAMQQASAVADAANIEFGVDDGQLFIAPRGAARKGTAPLINAATGMKGYPTFDKQGISLSCLFNPAIQLGGLIVIQSAIPMACGTWRVHMLKHNLEAEHPGGRWLTEIKASFVGA